jgi:hypothetical protein
MVSLYPLSLLRDMENNRLGLECRLDKGGWKISMVS